MIDPITCLKSAARGWRLPEDTEPMFLFDDQSMLFGLRVQVAGRIYYSQHVLRLHGLALSINAPSMVKTTCDRIARALHEELASAGVAA